MIVYQTSLSPVAPLGTPEAQGPPEITYRTAQTSEPLDESVSAPSLTHDASVHRDWVGKLAPLPGFTSPSGLGPAAKRIQIKPSNISVTSRPAVTLPEPVTSSDNLSYADAAANRSPNPAGVIGQPPSASPSHSPFALTGSLSNITPSTDDNNESINTPNTETVSFLSVIMSLCRRLFL